MSLEELKSFFRDVKVTSISSLIVMLNISVLLNHQLMMNPLIGFPLQTCFQDRVGNNMGNASQNSSDTNEAPSPSLDQMKGMTKKKTQKLSKADLSGTKAKPATKLSERKCQNFDDQISGIDDQGIIRSKALIDLEMEEYDNDKSDPPIFSTSQLSRKRNQKRNEFDHSGQKVHSVMKYDPVIREWRYPDDDNVKASAEVEKHIDGHNDYIDLDCSSPKNSR